MGTSPDVLVIGGGVIGLTAALYLAREGHAVTLLERGEPGREASWAGAGIVPPGRADRAAPPDRLRALSSSEFPRLSVDLLERTGVDNGFRVCGGVEFLGEDAAAVTAAWRAEGVAFERLGANTLDEVQPGLGAIPGVAHYVPGMAQVRNPRHLKALAAACRGLGVRLETNTAARGWRLSQRRAVAADTDAGPVSAGAFVVAAGAWADELLTAVDCRCRVRPVRGQIVQFRTGPDALRRVVLQGSCYIVPRGDGLVLVGATEEDAGFSRETTADGVTGLIQLAGDWVPALAGASIERSWAGLRPGSPDGLPHLGRVGQLDNLYAAVGHFRAGIQLSPGTALVLCDLLAGRPPRVPLEAFRPGRPPGPRVATAFRS